MRRQTHRRIVLSVVAALAGLLLVAWPAAASPEDDVIRDLTIDYQIDSEGLVHVTETYTWDFGNREGLGLRRDLDTRFDYPDEPDRDRVYRYSDFEVSSSTGAPADVWTYDRGSYLQVDVGAPDGSSDTRSGVQEYELRYTIEGTLNAIRDQAGVNDQDEFYWNATGGRWEVPIESTQVTITGPTDAVDAACYLGERDSADPCPDLGTEGAVVTAAAGHLAPGEELTVMAAYPPGTFATTDPILEESQRGGFGNGEAPGPVFWTGIGAVGIGAVVLAVLLRRRNRDYTFTGLTPGVIPATDQAPVQQLASKPEVAVRFTPPDRLTPAEVALLLRATPGGATLTATIISLAVRGYLAIAESGTSMFGQPNDWTLTMVRAPQHGELRPHDELIFAALFTGRQQVSFSQLRRSMPRTFRASQRQLVADVQHQQLFTKSPKARGAGYTLLGFLGIVIGFFSIFSIVALGAGWIAHLTLGLAATLVLLAIALGIGTGRRQRTALGRALFEQSRGFDLYLRTAKAEQLRWEEGEDIFSRYLPYAVVYGVAQRWAGLFDELARQGRYTAHTPWYIGSSGQFGSTNFAAMSRSLSAFGSATSNAATPGSSGGSGSSGGGGGSAGGGGGGGGGGGR